MSTINVSIVDQNLTITNAPTIAAGDINVDVIEFEFDESWDGFGCVAAFWRDGDPAVYRSAIYPATGRAVVPHEVMTEEGRICFGVVGQKDNMTKTSCVGYYDIKAGALTTGADTTPPTPDIYEQMLDAVGDVRQAFADALVEAEAAAGRVEIYDGLASDLPTHSAASGTLRRIELPSNMKLSDFDRVTIMLTNVGRSDLASGATGTLIVYTDNGISLGSITVGSSGGEAFIELAGLSGSPNSNVLRWASTSRYLNSGSPSTENTMEMHAWETNGVLAAAEHLDMLLSADTYVRVIGYCNEVAAQESGSVSVTPAAVASAIGGMNATQKAALKTALGYLTQHQSLAGYVTDTALASALANYVTSTGLSTELANYVTLTALGSAIADFVTSTGLNTVLASYVTSNALTAALAGYVAKDAQGTWTVNHTQPVVRKADGSLWVLPPGEGSGDTVIENTALITMATYGGDDYASLEAEDIFNILDAGAKNIILIDRAGRQCNLIVPPEEETNDFTVAKFWTFDESGEEIIIYSVGDGGLVSSATVSLNQGGGSTTLPELGGGYATDSAGGSTVARSVTISGFVRTVGNGPTVKFSNEISAKAPTLNINDGTDDTGAAAIWYCGSVLKPGTIRGGALVKLAFDGTHYCVEAIDGRPVIQLIPNQGVVSISGTYQDLVAKLKGAAVPQIICATPNTTMQNLELMELRHVWSNDTTSEIKLAGRVGGIEYYVVLTQSGSSGSEVMSGTLESCNITPDVVMQSSSTPTIAVHNNELHDCGTVTRITITDWPAEGDWGLEFTSPSSAATELIWSGGSHPAWPDGMTSFVPEAGKSYELNVHNGKALIGVWSA